MNDKINWSRVREEFEKDMNKKLEKLPGHREVSENLREFRGIISHELPETSPLELFEKLIGILLGGRPVDEGQARKTYLEPELIKEKEIIERNRTKFQELRESSKKWVLNNLSEEQLQVDWKEHRTWLPRRYTIYENLNLPFQEIAIDTLARYALIKGLG